jgi:hypothetical protein
LIDCLRIRAGRQHIVRIEKAAPHRREQMQQVFHRLVIMFHRQSRPLARMLMSMGMGMHVSKAMGMHVTMHMPGSLGISFQVCMMLLGRKAHKRQQHDKHHLQDTIM